MSVFHCVREDCPGAGDDLPFELFVVHALDHLFEEIQHMTDSISQLTQADADEAAAEGNLATQVGDLVTEQTQFLTEIKADLAGLGNNDQVSAIAVKIENRVSDLNAQAAKVAQLQSDQSGFDAGTAAPVSGIPASPVDPATAPATPIESTDDSAFTAPVDAPVGLADGSEASSPTD